MSRIIHSSSDRILHTRNDMIDILQNKIDANTKKSIGTELEIFVLNKDAVTPAANDDVARLALSVEPTIKSLGHTTHPTYELPHAVLSHIHIPEYGVYCFEPGGQIEVAPTESSTAEEAITKLAYMTGALAVDCADRPQVALNFAGHNPAFYYAAPDYPRSRFKAYYQFCEDSIGSKQSNKLIRTMKSCCGFQVNLDAGGKDFHDYYRVLMVLDPLIGLEMSNGPRKRMLYQNYGTQFPNQTQPIVEAVHSQSSEETLSHIARRVDDLILPFVPSDDTVEGFTLAKNVYGHYPTIAQLRQHGDLPETVFLNALSLQLYGPNLRRGAVLEMRGPDATHPYYLEKKIIAYAESVYNDEVREELSHRIQALDRRVLDDFILNAPKGPDYVRDNDMLGKVTVREFRQELYDCIDRKSGGKLTQHQSILAATARKYE